MRAISLQLKWQLLRYGPVAPRVWEEYGKLFAYAEEKGFVAAKVEVYPGKFGESTVQRECLKGLMLAISSTDSLLPDKLEIAERIVAQFSEFLLGRQPAKGCYYYVDLTTGKGPARMVSRLETTPGLRFFGPGSAAQELEKLITVLQADGVVPSNVNLGGVFDLELVLEVLRHLARYWAPVPPARSEERRRSVSRISVIHTFDEIVATVSADTQDLAFDNSAETWMVENESEGGYGALMPQTKGDWLKVGMLLGVKLEHGAAWGVGIVRRLSAYDLKQRYVGIQVLSKGATVVKLAPANAGSSNVAHDAVLLPSSTSESSGTGEMSLLVRPGVFSEKKNYEMQAYGRSYVLVPKKLLEGGDDFDMARFRVRQRATRDHIPKSCISKPIATEDTEGQRKDKKRETQKWLKEGLFATVSQPFTEWSSAIMIFNRESFFLLVFICDSGSGANIELWFYDACRLGLQQRAGSRRRVRQFPGRTRRLVYLCHSTS